MLGERIEHELVLLAVVKLLRTEQGGRSAGAFFGYRPHGKFGPDNMTSCMIYPSDGTRGEGSIDLGVGVTRERDELADHDAVARIVR